MGESIKFNILTILPKYFYYVILILIFSVAFTLYLQYQNITQPIREIVGTKEPVQATFQAFYLVIASVLIAILILFLLIKKKILIIQYIFVYTFSIGVFILFFLFSQPLKHLLLKSFPNVTFPLIFILILFFSSLLLFGIFKAKNIHIQNHSLIIVSCIFGSIIGGILEFIQLAIFLIVLSLYDIFAVSVGPIGKIIDRIEPSENAGNSQRFSSAEFDYVRGMFLELDKIEIGIGDIVLYSALLSNTLSIFSFKVFLAIIGISIGGFLTIFLLNKFKRLPGLPLPVFITLAFLFFL
jgi:Presenilin.